MNQPNATYQMTMDGAKAVISQGDTELTPRTHTDILKDLQEVNEDIQDAIAQSENLELLRAELREVRQALLDELDGKILT